MATRTITKTKVRTKVHRREHGETSSIASQSSMHAETSAQGAQRGIRPPLSTSSSAANSPHVLTSSGDEDGFGDDIRADIENEIKLKEAIKANGGRKPRKKVVESKAEKQTKHTRKALAKGMRLPACIMCKIDRFCIELCTMTHRPS